MLLESKSFIVEASRLWNFFLINKCGGVDATTADGLNLQNATYQTSRHAAEGDAVQ